MTWDDESDEEEARKDELELLAKHDLELEEEQETGDAEEE